jgi:hypothetical protein
MTAELAQFQKIISRRQKGCPWAFRLQETLRFVTRHPDAGPNIGLIPVGSNGIIVNSKLCARFFRLKDRNSCNRNFQQHGFLIDRRCDIADELGELFPTSIPGKREWVKRVFQFGSFNTQSSAQETGVASAYARTVRKHVPFRPDRPNGSECSSVTLDGEINFSDQGYSTEGWEIEVTDEFGTD